MSTSVAEPRQAVQPGAEPADPALAIRTRGLTKRFHGGQVAVDQLDLDVPLGSVFGFLGPNGSGKTTTIRMLLGLINPTAGSHRLLGLPMPQRASAVLPRVGSLVEGPAFHPHLSGTDNLRRVDAADRAADPATSKKRIGHALERVGLTAAARKRYRAYSLGMRQRLGIAAALLQPRELLVLDEPTNGLDPQGTREIRHLISELAADSTTVLLSTHLLSEVEQVCTHVGVMHVGKLVANGTLASLRSTLAPRVRVQTSEPAAAAKALTDLGLADLKVDGPEVSALQGENVPEELLRTLVLNGVPVSGYEVARADLEDIFVSLTGEGFDVSG